jgi:hypothetical protein
LALAKLRPGPTAAAVFVYFALLTPTAPHAGAVCDLASLLAEYKTGLNRHRDKDYVGALARWRPLAEQGFPPAQSRLAWLHGKGLGVKADIKESAFWALIAARGEDASGRLMASRLRKNLTQADFAKAERRARSWRPLMPDCWENHKGKSERLDKRRLRLGKYLIIVNKQLPDEVAELVFNKMRQVLATAGGTHPLAPLVLPAIDAFVIVPSDRYDRYVGWWTGGPGNVLLLSRGNFFDDRLTFVGRMIFLEAARWVFANTPGSRFIDPLVATHKNKKLYGTVYPDIDNELFYKNLKQALQMAEKLPPELGKYVEIIDEIRYIPPSKHFAKGGTLDATIAYYNKVLSSEGRRIIFIRREMRWSSPLDVLINLVHEGTHAVQDQKAERFEAALPGLREALRRIDANGKGRTSKAKALQRQIKEKSGYVRRWKKPKISDHGISETIPFECQAVVNEIRTARAVEAPPSSLPASGYLALCDDAKTLLVRWKDESLLGKTNRKRKNITSPSSSPR